MQNLHTSLSAYYSRRRQDTCVEWASTNNYRTGPSFCSISNHTELFVRASFPPNQTWNLKLLLYVVVVQNYSMVLNQHKNTTFQHYVKKSRCNTRRWNFMPGTCTVKQLWVEHQSLAMHIILSISSKWLCYTVVVRTNSHRGGYLGPETKQ